MTIKENRGCIPTRKIWRRLRESNLQALECEVKVRLRWTRSNAKRRLATFACGRSRNSIKIAKHSLTFLSKLVKLSNRLRKFVPDCNLSFICRWHHILVALLRFDLLCDASLCFASSVNAISESDSLSMRTAQVRRTFWRSVFLKKMLSLKSNKAFRSTPNFIWPCK